MSKRWLALAASFTVVVGFLTTVPANPALAVQTAQTQVVSQNPASYTPNVLDGRVESIVQVGSLMVISGTFTQIRAANSSTVLTRNRVAAFDAETGVISNSFAPDADDEVNTVLPGPLPGTVYLAGNFNKIDGKGPGSVALLRVADGSRVASFAPGSFSGGRPNDLRLAGGRLWVGGNFASIGGVAQPALATLDPLTGALDPFMGLVLAGTHNGGKTSVLKMDVTPDGTRLVLVGNFVTIGGLRNEQAAMLDLTGSSAQLANWQTAFYQAACSSSFNSYMRDVDISPDGSYFVITTTGAYGGSSSPCDSSSRWDFSRTGSGVSATWVAYTGGDTTYAVAVTGSAVYVGGHFRWQNNPLAGDSAGQGAVSRPGIAALDPTNGLPLAWNPGRPLGVGVFDLLATPTGLWMGSDTDYTNSEYHAKLAFFPLSGGTVVPGNQTGALPGTVYMAGRLSGAVDTLQSVSFTGVSTGTPSVMAGGGVAWGSTRGAMMINNVLYTGQSDGSFVARTFDGSNFGAPTVLSDFDALKVLSGFHTDLRTTSGMFFSNGRLYYTKTGTSQLNYRYFTPSSGIVNALVFSGGTSAATGVDWSRVGGMFQANGKIYYSSTADGVLRSVAFVGGQAVAGTIQAVSGPGIDGIDWRARGLFLLPTNSVPTAEFTSDCVVATCSFDASASADADGFVKSYAWDFGDGTTGSGVAPVHTYAASGTVTVKLTVTDDQGATSATTHTVSPLLSNVPPTAVIGSSCLGLSCTFDASGSHDSDGSIAEYAWDFGDGSSSSDSVVDHNYAANGTYTVSLAVTDDRGGNAVATRQVSVTSAVASVDFRAKAGVQVNADTASVTTPSPVRVGDGLLLIASVAGSTTIGDPSGTGWSKIGGPTTTGSLVTQMWQKVAGATDAGAKTSVSLPGAYKMTLQLLAYSGTDANSPVASSSVQGDAVATTQHASPTAQVDQSGTAVVSYWADKSSTTTAWTAPAGVVMRDTELGSGSGRVTSLVADATGVGTGQVGGLVATTDAPSRATSITVVLKAAVAANQAPTARFSMSCDGRDCSFDGTSSSDSDGYVASYAWAFGDGATATGPTATHTYDAGGTFDVALTVTDNAGGTGDVTKHLTVVPNAATIGFRAQASTQANGTTATITVPSGVRSGDGLILVASVAGTTTLAAPPGWTAVGAPQTTGSLVTQVWQRVAQTGDAGRTVSVTLGQAFKVGVELLAYSGTSLSGPVGATAVTGDQSATTSHPSQGITPTASGSWVVTYWADKSSTTTAWTVPAGVQLRDVSYGSGSGRTTMAVVDSGGAVGTGTTSTLVASTDAASRATVATLELLPGTI